MNKRVHATAGRRVALIAILTVVGGATTLAATDLTPIALAPVPGETYYAATIGDADNDGQNELVVSTWPSGILAICDVSGDGAMTCPHQLSMPVAGWGWWYVSPRVIDMDGDGDNDIVAWARVNSQRGQLAVATYAEGTWSFATYPTPETDAGYYMDIGDLDGDGLPDLVTTDFGTSAPGAVYISRNSAVNPFSSAFRLDTPTLLAVLPRLFDLDGDGDRDIAVASHPWGSVAVGLAYNDAGSFALSNLYPGDGSHSLGIGFGDIDGDGFGDLVSSATWPNTYLSRAFFYPGSNNGFGNAAAFDTGTGPASVAVTDFDSDGYADVVIDDTVDRTLGVYRGGPAGVGAREVVAGPLLGVDHGQSGHSETLSVGDLDNDGDVDVVFAWAGVVFIRNGQPGSNGPPTAVAGPDQTLPAGADCAAEAALDGRGSDDPDGDPLTYVWNGSFGSLAGPTALLSLAVGSHPVTLTVADPAGAASSDSLVVNVVDAQGPSIASATAQPSLLWPPNHKMVNVNVDVHADDNCTASPACAITSVASSEPVNGTGDGDTSPDWTILDADTVALRAERSGHGSGRVYTVTLTCADGSGNQSSRAVAVTVPKNGGR